jgi:hypothetical protein
VAPCISLELKNWIISWLNDGFIARKVFEEHKRVWYQGWTKDKKHKRDNSLLSKHVRYYEYQTKRSLWYRDKNTLISLKFRRLENLEFVSYQDSEGALDISFILSIQTPWQRATS